MSNSFSRRHFLQSATTTAAALGLSRVAFGQDKPANPNPVSTSPKNEYQDIRVAFVGVGGRGAGNLAEATKAGCTPAALVDIDANHLGAASKKHPNAKTFDDYRRMLDAMHKDIDAVLVATPDHTHANIALAAMSFGKHVYVEKPLSYDIWEARQLLNASRRYKVQTQMGNQHHAKDGLRSAVDAIRAGVLGNIKEVHVWTDRPIWPQGMQSRPAGQQTPPAHVNWDAWLGPAPLQNFDPSIHPFKWRGWWDYGTGALGDMGCHLIDPPFWALHLDNPISVEAVSEGNTQVAGPLRSAVTYKFAATKLRPALKMVWYDGGMLPPRELTDDQPLPDKKNGNLYVGEKGVLFAATGAALENVGPKKDIPTKAPNPTIPSSPGQHAEWLRAIATDGAQPAACNFEYSCPLTETVLLGNLAVRLGKKVVWDSENLRALNAPEAAPLIRRPRRKGWELSA